MSKVTSKLQVTIPKLIAERFGIVPGDEVEWEPGPDAVRIVAAKSHRRKLDAASRLCDRSIDRDGAAAAAR
ncbi:MAG TPA: AbrB/MazE/SpoVT family DNA-binding domain-containing protein [Polyangiales bacterium]|nr:AbrB/MazE/SpoVT family DNA-binding domain-containing protein [Polyangiales bacterium]